MIQVQVASFEEWRDHARTLLALKVAPHDVQWNSPQQAGLFDDPLPYHQRSNAPVSVPKGFIELAKNIACHRDSKKWEAAVPHPVAAMF